MFKNLFSGKKVISEKEQIKDFDRTYKISVIIPIYNAEAYLNGLFEMLLKQTFTDFELICVDDGSTDGSAKIVKNHMEKDDRIKYIHKQNGGAGSARNVGLDNAKGEYVIWLDVDDIYESNLLEEMYKTATFHDAEITICAFNSRDERVALLKKDVGFNKSDYPDNTCVDPGRIDNLYLSLAHGPTNKLYKIASIKEWGLRFSETKVANDVFFVLGAMSMAKRVVAIHNSLMTFRRHHNPSSISSNRGKHTDDITKGLNQLYGFLCEKGLEKKFGSTFTSLVDVGIYYNAEYGATPQFIDAVEKMITEDLPWRDMDDRELLKSLRKSLDMDFINRRLEYKNREKDNLDGDPDEYFEEELRRMNNILETISILRDRLTNKHGKNLDLPFDISVVIPVYNISTFLRVCLNSLKKALNGLWAEVICVDDESTDDSMDVLDEFALVNAPIKAYRIKHGGAGAARNYGVSLAKGKYIAFIDGDDVVSEFMLRDLLYACESQNVPMAICNISRYKSITSATVSGQYQRAFMGKPKLVTNIQENLPLIYDGSPCNKLISRSFWDEHGFRFPEGQTYEDMPVILRLFCEADSFAVIQSFGYYWRIRPGGDSVSQDLASDQALEDRMMACADMLRYLKEKWGDDSEIKRYMEDRIVSWEFDNFLENIYKIDRDTAKRFIEKIGAFYKNNISEEVLEGITKYHKRKYDYIVAGDIDNLYRLMNHKRLAWRSAPIEDRDGVPCLKLPEDIYGYSYEEAALELKDDLALTSLTLLQQNGNKTALNVVLYQPRINVANKGDQEVTPYLYNDHTGETIELSCEPLEVKPWTKTHGTQICNDDYKIYQYNYDWAGIRMNIDFEELIKQDLKSIDILNSNYRVRPRWLLFFKYKTPLSEGERILRGISMKAKAGMANTSIIVNHLDSKYEYRISQDLRGTLFIELMNA